MKNTVYIWLIITTLVLVAVAIMGALNAAFQWVYIFTVTGQVLLIISVFKVLRDDYKTDKTFKDWYEDRPRKNKMFNNNNV